MAASRLGFVQSGESSDGDQLDIRRVIDRSRCGLVLVDVNGVVRYASAPAAEMAGIDPADAVGASILEWLHPDDVARALQSLEVNLTVRGISYFPMVFRLRHLDGHHLEVDVLATNLLDDDLGGIVLSIRRADDRTQYVDPIRAIAAGASHHDVLELIAAGVGRGGHSLRPAFIAWSPGEAGGAGEIADRLISVRADLELVDAMRQFVIARAQVLFERPPRDVQSIVAAQLPEPLRSVVVASGAAGLRVASIPTGDGTAALISVEPLEAWMDGRWTPSSRDHWGQLIDLATVAFERERSHRALVHAATHDALTGLANRAHFFRRLAELGAQSAMWVLYLDLDRFKAVNDRHGHFRGDEVLAVVAARIASALGPEDLAGRLGGDEFAVAIARTDAAAAIDPAGLAEVDAMVERIRAAVGAPLPAEFEVDAVGISIGVAHMGIGQPVDQAVHRADSALLDLKRGRRAGE